ncbi:MAG: hypothetical protein OXT09_01355 [Myxococcales bacterium]|nr:hypothetical protein [Myxococcales bacterium]
MRCRVLTASLWLVLVGCDAAEEDSSRPDDARGGEVPESGGAEPEPGDGPTGAPDSIDSHRHDGVWLFSLDPAGGGDSALGSGAASIVDGCLVIGEEVVVWLEDDLDFARSLIDSVAAGEAPKVTVGGGGIALGEGATVDDLPMTVLSRCGARDVWFASAPGERLE